MHDQPTEIIEPEDVVFIRDNAEASRVFYDVTNDTMQEVISILSGTLDCA